MDKHQQPIERLAYSVSEVRALTGLSTTTIYALMKRDELAFRKIGARRLIPAAALHRLIGEAA